MTAKRIITFNGESGDLQFWANKLKITKSALKQRLYVRNWTIEKTLSTPQLGPYGKPKCQRKSK